MNQESYKPWGAHTPSRSRNQIDVQVLGVSYPQTAVYTADMAPSYSLHGFAPMGDDQAAEDLRQFMSKFAYSYPDGQTENQSANLLPETELE